MNLSAIAAAQIAVINPFITATILVSTGATVQATGKTVPTYAAPVELPIQWHALSGRDLRHLESLNVQGVTRKAYFNSNIQGINRPAGTGGDLIEFGTAASVPTELQGTTWLVEVVLEAWDASSWVSVGLIQQLDGADD